MPNVGLQGVISTNVFGGLGPKQPMGVNQHLKAQLGSKWGHTVLLFLVFTLSLPFVFRVGELGLAVVMVLTWTMGMVYGIQSAQESLGYAPE